MPTVYVKSCTKGYSVQEASIEFRGFGKGEDSDVKWKEWPQAFEVGAQLGREERQDQRDGDGLVSFGVVLLL